MISVTQKTAPTTALLSLGETKQHLRVDHADEDGLILGLIDAAQKYLEGPFGTLGRTIMRQTWTGRVAVWPLTAYVEIPLPPFISLDEVRLIEDDGSETVWPVGNYRVQGGVEQPARLWSVETWPSANGASGFAFDFTAGYGDQHELPENIRAAALMIVADFYDNRAAFADREAYKNPTVERMLAPFKVWYI